jgi:hypothetical protein
MDPLDALVLSELAKMDLPESNPTERLLGLLKVTPDELDASRINLTKLGLHVSGALSPKFTHLGRQIALACAGGLPGRGQTDD